MTPVSGGGSDGSAHNFLTLNADGYRGPQRVAVASSERDWAVVTSIFLTLAAWILCHPYHGIVHDNRLYALLALNFNDPTLFARDLFLKSGSQDSFTFFSPIYAWSIRLIGLDWSTRLLAAAGQLLWVLSALALIRRVVVPRLVWLALLFLAVYPPFYGGNSIFAIAESFLSPRLFVEALGLAALAAFMGGRSLLAVLLLIAGALLHPLMIAAPAGVILALALTRNASWRATAVLVASGAVLVVLALIAVHLADLPILPVIDAEWKFIVDHRAPQFMLANWEVPDWLQIACDLIIIMLACIHAAPPVRQLLVASMAIGVASLAVSFVGFELLDDLTTGKLQIWRALWLVHAFAPVSLALLLQDASRRDSPERPLLLILPLGFVAITSICFAGFLPPLGISVVLLFAVLYLTALKQGSAIGPRDRALMLISLSAIVLVALSYLFIAMPGMVAANSLNLHNPLLRHVLASIAVLLAGLLLFNHRAARHARLLAVVAVAAFCGLLLTVDQRSEWRRYIDSSPGIATELQPPIAPGELVYWSSDVMALWGALRNPSFYSDVQGAGVIFNRATATEYLHRLRLVEHFEPANDHVARLLGKPDTGIRSGVEADITLNDLVRLCTNPDHPDVVVLSQNIPGAKGVSWKPRVGFQRAYLKSVVSGQPRMEDIGVKQIDEYFFYRCREVGQLPLGLK